MENCKNELVNLQKTRVGMHMVIVRSLLNESICKQAFSILLTILIVHNLMGQHNDGQSTVVGPSGNEYATVKIGQQWWMQENLNTSHFRNGDTIPHLKKAVDWQNSRTTSHPGWCFYDNNPQYGNKYGKLYNWHVVADARGVCPEGWRVPLEEDWQELMVFVGMHPDTFKTFGWRGNISGELRSTRTEPEEHPRWDAPNEDATNSSGYSALPGGYRTGDPNYTAQKINTFRMLGKEAAFWYGEDKIAWGLWPDRSEIFRGGAKLSKGFGFSIRCVKEN